ncbi:hypothetical protein GCM10010885_20470 [Alicyclobacillus cellulosilyticus]|uniref:CheW-like domain-containing protein n=1 Tax=Alicyclobacillus cellulosilyticus TaxID=1003997 RepID=A0A917KF23_9BACL|nr:hypothetical protein [Alicyclobacillus cellulosilyticus]GGJ11109.1 hypothetical protein GCM10010885_20470 [Alicyclobacillus cellulosilyticus]
MRQAHWNETTVWVRAGGTWLGVPVAQVAHIRRGAAHEAEHLAVWLGMADTAGEKTAGYILELQGGHAVFVDDVGQVEHLAHIVPLPRFVGSPPAGWYLGVTATDPPRLLFNLEGVARAHASGGAEEG